MIWLLVAVSHVASVNLCLPPPKIGQLERIGRFGESNLWLYEIRKGKKLQMRATVACFADDRPLEDILREADRIRGHGGIDLWEDRRLPIREGCNDNVGYIERNGDGGYSAVVYGRRPVGVASLRIDTSSRNKRPQLIRIIEEFRTHLLGC